MSGLADRTIAEDTDETSYDTSDPEQVNKARKRSGRKRADRLHFVEAAMGQREGRAWFFGILTRCHIYHTPYSRGDSYQTTFNCGEHNIGLQILADIQAAAPKEYLTMLKEAKEQNG